MPDPNLGALTALRRLRHAETDAARRDLGEAVSRENAVSARETALCQELDTARRFSGDFDHEAFAAWFSRMRAERARLGMAMQEAASRTASARIVLAHRRVAETAAEAALADAMATRKVATERQEQAMLEDVARALKHRPG